MIRRAASQEPKPLRRHRRGGMGGEDTNGILGREEGLSQLSPTHTPAMPLSQAARAVNEFP
jgi:hypothetical protein